MGHSRRVSFGVAVAIFAADLVIGVGVGPSGTVDASGARSPSVQTIAASSLPPLGVTGADSLSAPEPAADRGPVAPARVLTGIDHGGLDLKQVESQEMAAVDASRKV